MFSTSIRMWFQRWFQASLARHTKIKLAFWLFFTNLFLLLGDFISGDNWTELTIWVFGTYAASNVGATYAHARHDEVVAKVEKEKSEEGIGQ